MSAVLHRDLLRFVWIPNLNFEHLMKAYIKRQRITSVAIFLIFIWWMSLLCNIFGFKRWSQIRRIVNWNNAYFKAALLISIAYATLLVINPRYISVVIIPIIVLIFIGALYVVVTPKANPKCDEDNIHTEANKAHEFGSTPSKEDSNGSAGDNDNGLFATAVLPCWVLCCMAHFNIDNLVVSQFLLFLTSTLGELALMMARLPSEDVAVAFQVIRRASLVVVLVTAHTMAAELLGDDVVLACAPELITGLVWFSVYFGHSGGGSTSTVRIDMVTSHKARIVFLTVVAPIMAWVASSTTDGSTEAATDLMLLRFLSVLVACFFSVLLPTLCVFALRQWPVKSTAAAPSSSSEMEGAIKLLSFCRDMMFIAATAYLVLMPLVQDRLRLQAYHIVADTLNRFVNRSVIWLFNVQEPIYRPH